MRWKEIIAESQGVRIDAVLYHGSSNSFDQFEPGHSNGWSNPRAGFYFTDDKDVVAEFFGKPIAWRVRMTNAANFEHGAGSDIVMQMAQKSKQVAANLEEVRQVYGTEMEERFLSSRFAARGYLQTPEFIAGLRQLGFDGMIFDDLMSQTPFTSYVAFDAKNINKVS